MNLKHLFRLELMRHYYEMYNIVNLSDKNIKFDIMLDSRLYYERFIIQEQISSQTIYKPIE